MKPRLVKPSSAVSVTAEVTPRDIRFESDEGGLYLTATGLVIKGKPLFGDWENALIMADEMERRSPFWKADLLAYAYKRPDWEGLIDAVIDAGRFTEATVRQYRSLSARVPRSDRVEGLSLSHHEAVAALPSEDKRELLTKAKREHLSVSALKQVVRQSRKVKRVLKGQASELAKAHDAVVQHAHEAAEHCQAIPRHDCKDAEKLIAKAIRALERTSDALDAYRKAQGKQHG